MKPHFSYDQKNGRWYLTDKSYYQLRYRDLLLIPQYDRNKQNYSIKTTLEYMFDKIVSKYQK